MTQTRSDSDWMGQAISMAKRGLGLTWPNPSVGCVIVKDSRLVGRGVTQPGGRPHAEVMALRQAGPQATGATAYVTLEPCSHTGKSPPCTTALIKAGIKRVVFAQSDPDPRVECQKLLKDAGIAVEAGICGLQASRINRGFTSRITQKRPFITLKLAATLDGKIATSRGESRWITGPCARRLVHTMRSSHDAVMIGRGTAEADDPMLDVRGMGARHQPVRIVLDRQLKLSKSSRLVKTASNIPTWLIHHPDADTHNLAATDCKLIASEAPLTALAHDGITRVFCEGGATLAASLIQDDVVDELVLFTAGKAIGGDGVSALASLGLNELAHAPQFSLSHCHNVGEDIVSVWQKKAAL